MSRLASPFYYDLKTLLIAALKLENNPPDFFFGAGGAIHSVIGGAPLKDPPREDPARKDPP